MASRPEYQGPPELFYNEVQAKKYTSNSRMIEIQQQLSERALELLALPDDQPSLILDIGCGSGLSGECLSEYGHSWVGIDISSHMLDVAVDREVEGDLVLGDMGFGMPFRPGTFDAVISISALQWLCNADKKCHHPPKRLYQFFSTLYSCLLKLAVKGLNCKIITQTRGARAVFQLYPDNSQQLELITKQSMKAGFSGGLVIDYPNSSKAKKMFLCLFSGGMPQALPKALGTADDHHANTVSYTEKRDRMRQARGKPLKKSKVWVLQKKERERNKGKHVRPDSKYTGRKRGPKF